VPLIDVQRRFRELGRIRMGTKGVSQNGRTYPKKLSEWRLTSTNRELLDVAADVYGGNVAEWTGAPTEGRQWELFTGTDRLDVLVPPGEPLSQHWELWSGGGCVRRCNGVAQTTGEACACPADLEARAEASKSGNACKATTRLSIVLPRIPDIGVWRVESHGMNAAVELPGTVDILRSALDAGGLVPAQLRLEARTSKKDGETRHFIVPVLELPSVTMAQLQSGGPQLQLETPDAAPPRAAIGSGGGNGLGVGSDPNPSRPGSPSPRSLPPLPNELAPPNDVGPCFHCDFIGTRTDVRAHLIAEHGYVPDSSGKAHPPPAPTPAPESTATPLADNDVPDTSLPGAGHPRSATPLASDTGAGEAQGASAAPAPVPSDGPSQKQLKLMAVLFRKAGVTTGDRHRTVSHLLGLDYIIGSLNDLTTQQTRQAIDALEAEAAEVERLQKEAAAMEKEAGDG
jgi:hypothetical protein